MLYKFVALKVLNASPIFGILLLLMKFLDWPEFIGIVLCFLGLKFVPEPYAFQGFVGCIWLLPFVFRSILVTERYDTGLPFIECKQLELDGSLVKGDIIEFERTVFPTVWTSNFHVFRKVYAHWGIYYEHGTIYHFTTHEDGSPASVGLEDLVLAAQGQRCRINNLEKVAAAHHGLTRRTDEEIFATARSYLDSIESMNYKLIKYNCEHFVTECVYGKPFSVFADEAYTFMAKEYIWCHCCLFVIYVGIYHAWKVDFVRKAVNDFFVSEIFLSFWNSSVIQIVKRGFEALLYEMEHHENRFLVEVAVCTLIFIWPWIWYCEWKVEDEGSQIVGVDRRKQEL